MSPVAWSWPRRRLACPLPLLLRLLLPGALVAAGACTGTNEATYAFEIKGPRDVFKDATTVSLFQNNKMVATSPVTAGGRFSLEVGNLQPLISADPVVFSIKAFDANHVLVAYGEAPGVEILPQDNTQLRIFVQKPGSIAQVDDMPIKLKDHIAFESETVSNTTTDYHVTAPVFGYGTTTGDVAQAGFYIYNPLLHVTQKLGELTPARRGVAGMESASLSRGSHPLLLFGGLGVADMKLAERLDEMVIVRGGLSDFSIGVTLKITIPTEFARAGGVLATTNSGTRRLVFGGRDDAGNPIAHVAAIDEITGSPMVVTNHPAMAAARDGHTVTVDPSTTDADKDWGRILVYGGAAPGAPVAELLNPKTPPKWLDLPAAAPAGTPPGAHPGTGRRDHQALILPTKSAKGSMRVLIVGGRDDAKNVRGDSIVCVPAEARFEDSPLKLSEPRADFAAFIVKDDLVVVGGVDGNGAPVASAEIFSASTLAVKAKVAAFARIRPTATTLGNSSTIIIGGEAADKTPLATVEIYQPTRTE